MKRIQRQCSCCGTAFMAGHDSAKFCSGTCKARAYHRRRRGAPEADAALVVQPTILGGDDLPLQWRQPVAGLEQRVWQGTAIQRREADGFVNATAMCKANGRLWAKYQETERCQSYLAALSKMSEIRTFDLIQARRGRAGGTWIHPSLAIDLARWISPAFAVWMDGWFLESFAKPALPPAPPLKAGVHVVAPTHRDACRLWKDAVEKVVMAAIDRKLGWEHRPYDISLPLPDVYNVTITGTT